MLLLASCGNSADAASDAATTTASTTAAPTTAAPTTIATTTTAAPTTAAPTTIATTTTTAATSSEDESRTDPDAAINEGFFVGLVAAELDQLGQGWTDDQIIEFGYDACESMKSSGTDLIDAIGATTANVAENSELSANGASSWLAAQTIVIAAGPILCDSDVEASAKEGLAVLESYELTEVRYLIVLHATTYPFFTTPDDADLLTAGEAACAELDGSTEAENTERILAWAANADVEPFFTTVAAGSVDSLCPQHAAGILAALNQL